MNKRLTRLLISIAICFIAYFLLRNLNLKEEGMIIGNADAITNLTNKKIGMINANAITLISNLTNINNKISGSKTVLQYETRQDLKYLLLTQQVNKQLCDIFGYKYLFVSNSKDKHTNIYPAINKIYIVSEFLNSTNSENNSILIVFDSDAWVQNPYWLNDLVEKLQVDETKQGCFSRDPYISENTFVNSGSFILKINNYTRNMYSEIIDSLENDESKSRYRTAWQFDQFYVSDYVYSHKKDFYIFVPDVLNTPLGKILRHNWYRSELMYRDLNLLANPVDNITRASETFNFETNYDKEDFPNIKETNYDYRAPLLNFKDGDLVKGQGRSIFLVKNKTLHEFPDADTFVGMGYEWNNVSNWPSYMFNLFTIGNPVPPLGYQSSLNTDTHGDKQKNISDTISITNTSVTMLDYITKYPPEWRFPIKLCVVADQSYISSVVTFYSSLQTFGFTSLDISVFCVTIECKQQLSHLNITSDFIRADECVQIRCHISLGKARAIRITLSKGYSVFFFDLDVYFKSSPLHNLVLDALIDIYAQKDDDNKSANYGCILIKPTPETVSTFKELEVDAFSNVWDQQLMNDQIKKRHVPFAFLDSTQYFIFLHRTERFPTSMNLVHMICIEGALNKFLIGRQRGGPFSTPLLYTSNKTVAIHVDYDSPKHHTSFTRRQLVGMIRRMIEISMATGRIIRLNGWKYFNPVKSLFDVDLLNIDYNITLVEGIYWENFIVFNSGFNLSTLNYSINAHQDYDNFLKLNSDHNYDSTGEIFISFNTTYLDDSYDSKYDKFVCTNYDASSTRCLKTCSGHHFRFRN